MGEVKYRRELNVPVAQVKLVKAFQSKGKLLGMKVPEKFKEALSHDRSLPGGLLLPTWLEYNHNKNMLLAKSGSPDRDDAGTYLIRVYSHGDVIVEEFELEVQSDIETQPLVTS